MFQFIHCADIHLGCSPGRNDNRFNDFFKAFQYVIEYAITKEIKLILISGDFFQMRAINPKTLDKTVEILEKAKDEKIEIIAIEGNHDQAYYVDEDSWLSFLHSQKYLTLLQSEIENGKIKLLNYNGKKGNIIEKDDYRIVGIDYLGGSTEKYLQELQESITQSNKYTILMLHAAINRLIGQNMGDIKGESVLALKEKINYLALGHIHYRYEAYDFAFNPGALENIRIRDAHQTEKGFYHVTVDDEKQHQIKFIPSNPRKTVFLKVDVSDAKIPDDVLSIVKSNLLDIEKGCVLEVNLYGQVDFNPYLINTNEIYVYFKTNFDIEIVEINNYVNLLTTKQQSNEDDLDVIISNLIIEEIKTNYPTNSNPEKTAERIINITNMVTDEVEDDDIINMLVDEDKL